MLDLFVSHATLDDAIANSVAEGLEKQGITTWVDHRSGGLQPGAPNWDRALREAIGQCTAAVLLMTPRSLASDICDAECQLVRELGKPLYVAYVATCEPKDIWLSIKKIQYADLRTDFDGGLKKLVRALRGDHAPDLPTSLKSKVTGGDMMREQLPYLNSVPLVGRDADLDAIRALLGPHVTQIVAVGGTGKSRIAAQTALEYPHGAIWHRCSPLSSAFQIMESIRRHYGLDEKMPEALVLAPLDTNPPLIVLDNAEDVAANGDQRAAYVALVARLAGHGVPLLLTSRAAWEELKPRKHHPLIPLDIGPASALAVDFAIADGLALSDTDARRLASAALLHPRLIEFAVRQLHERELDDVLRMLSELRHDDVQEALNEMVVKTVNQMAAQAKGGEAAARLLRRLTVFHGLFDRAALKALKPADLEDDNLDDVLVVLQRWGFLRRQPGGRWVLDDVTIGALPPDDEAVTLHFGYYHTLHSDFEINNNEDCHTQIEANWANIRSALAWGWLNRPNEAVDFIVAIDYFMRLRISHAEHDDLLQVAYYVANNAGYQFGQANTLKALGDVARMRNDYDQAVAFYDRAYTLGQAIGDFPVRLNVLRKLGQLERQAGNMPAACDAYSRALALADSHPFFKRHPVLKAWRQEYVELGCGDTNDDHGFALTLT